MNVRADHGRERLWAGTARCFVLAAAGLLIGYLSLAYLVDPYDSGRSRLFSVDAVRPQGSRTAAAVRGRDPAFTGAILGNSHIQLVEPARLFAETGIPFLQLSVTATGPTEQLALLAWYLRHHPEPRALVLAVDDYWCSDDPALPNAKPFPFWLFSEDIAAYLGGLLRWSVLEEIPSRIGWLLRNHRESAARDGWSDYEKNYLSRGYRDDDARGSAKRALPVPDDPDPGTAGPVFPAAARLEAAAAALPAGTALVLVFPPVYASALARPGSARERAENACKSALRDALGHHRLSAVVDWRRDRPETRDPAYFFDQTHYRHPVARLLTAEIAEKVRELAARHRDAQAR